MKTTGVSIEVGVRGRLVIKEDDPIVMRIDRFLPEVNLYYIRITTPDGENLGSIRHDQIAEEVFFELLEEYGASPAWGSGCATLPQAKGG